ncbi:hypothetical protein D0C16_08770 [Cellvibrio sp. KY-GH-1]|uniref:RAQPRD family integrative conjugative element protein n=1 Tax=Cellvibrio sp. KY-GH-1 TaxID=2303332 RepID=UPI001246CA31|nr:RAQPRD family integrative conjugative element protein [Cellvibrio sp. KY-GH-1]QEY16067.1 hypothetical protein D0C16_08770 [Cellvibrio sp. KY-GH-1]
MKNMLAVLMSAALIFSHSVLAEVDTTTEAEKRYLIKVAQELKHLDELAAKAASNADPDARVTLDYVALRNDLQEMRRALEAHLQKPSRSPRRIDELTFAGRTAQ